MKKTFASFALMMGIVAATAGAASAQCPESTPEGTSCTVEVKPQTPDTPDPAGPSVESSGSTSGDTASLPVTGAETSTIAFAGLVLVAGGGLLVAKSRKGAHAA